MPHPVLSIPVANIFLFRYITYDFLHIFRSVKIFSLIHQPPAFDFLAVGSYFARLYLHFGESFLISNTNPLAYKLFIYITSAQTKL
jgi:hypothetical protein